MVKRIFRRSPGRFALCILFIAITASFCAPIKTTDKTSSWAIKDPEATYLGRTAGSIAAGHGEDSGFLLLDRGRDALSWRAIFADAAEQSIDAQYFLWKDDDAGKIMMQRLLDAAERGVRVRVLVDDSMTDSDPQYLARFGAYPNVSVRIYKPFGPKHKSYVLRWIDFVADLKRLNRRMHNKLFLVDGSAAIVGGRNIGNEYFEYPGPYVFRSRDLLALGPVASSAAKEFDLYWNSDWAVPIEMAVAPVPTVEEAREQKASLDAFAADPSHYPEGFYGDPKETKAKLAGLGKDLLWGKATLLFDAVPDPDGKPQPHAVYDRTGVVLGQTMEKSTDEVLIESAYLILVKDAFTVLDAVGKKGVKIKLVTNSMAANNHLTAFEGYRKQRKKMLAIPGTELFEIRPDFKSERELFTAEELEKNKTRFGLHAKTTVFDRRIVFVGSFNVDPRSVNLNTEMGLLVESETLGKAVAESIEGDMAAGNSWQVILKDNGKVEWVTRENGVITAEEDKEPMTTAAQRAKARALAIVPDESQL
jgi:putative cardiolipin synthase